MPYIISMDTWFNSGGGLPYGACYGNEIAWAQAAAVQNTWYDISDADMVSGGLHNVAHDGSGQLSVTYAGFYYCTWYISAEIDAVNKHVQVTFSVNGTETNDSMNHFESVGASKQQTMSGVAILDLAAADTLNVSIRITDAGTPDLAVDHLGFAIIQVGGT